MLRLRSRFELELGSRLWFALESSLELWLGSRSWLGLWSCLGLWTCLGLGHVLSWG